MFYLQYHQAQVSRAPSNYLTNNQRNSSSPFGHSVIQKAPDSVYHQQFSAGPKTNGPSAMMSVSSVVNFGNVFVLNLLCKL